MNLLDEIYCALPGPRPPRMRLRHEDGYRYVRSYDVGTGPARRRRWQAWERQACRMVRVGTLTTEDGVTAFLLHLDQRTAP